MPKPFFKLILATGLGNLSDGLFLVALPLYVSSLTREPKLIAGIVSIALLPWLIFAPFAGALVDFFDRKRTMVLVNTVRCALLLVLTMSLAFHWKSLAWLYLIAFLMGVTEVLFDTASATILPAIVSKRELERANNRLLATQLVTNDFLGKPIGGFFFGVVPWLPFLIQALAQGVAARAAWAIPGAFRPTVQPAQSMQTLWLSMVEGFRWLLKHPTLRTLSILSLIRNILEAGASAILVLYALEILQISEAAYGALLACAAVGALLATFVVKTILKRFGPGTTLVVSIVLARISFGVIGLFPDVLVVGCMLALFAVTEVIWGVVSTSFRQAVTPDRLLGRVNGSSRLTSRGTRAIGALLGGVTASLFGLSAPFVLMGIVIVAMGLFAAPYLSNRAFEVFEGPVAAVVGDD